MAKRRKPSARSDDTRAADSEQTESRAGAAAARLNSTRKRAKRRLSGRSPLERAQKLAGKAIQTASIERRFALAQRALELSNDCADAYTILSRFASDPRQALELLEQGLAAAERVLGPAGIAAAAGQFWEVHRTRPYMRARLALAECLWTLGCAGDAVGHLQALLELNPADHQGARYVLAAHLLELNRDADFDGLVARYDEPATFLVFSRALREFRRNGDSPPALRRLARARKANPHVVPLLLNGVNPDEELPEAFTAGQRDEAVLFVAEFGGGWRQTPGAITWLRKSVGAARRSRKTPAGPTDAARKQLQRLPQSYGTIWQAAVSRVATWLRDGDRLARPWSILIVDHSGRQIIVQELVTQEPTPDIVFDCLSTAMRRAQGGRGHRPSEIQVRDQPLWKLLQPHLEEIGVDCIFRSELEETDYILAEMSRMMRPHGQPPGIAEAPTFASAQGASVYDAAADFFRRAPWRKLPDTALVQVNCPQMREFGPGRWYAVVLGQAGQTRGLAVYSDRQAVEAVCGGSANGSGDATALSLLFGEGFEIPIVDLLAAEQHRWPVASPEAYPLILCTSGGQKVRPLEPWELQLLEACVRTIPEFVEQYPYVNGPSAVNFAAVAPANLKLTLSWAEPAESSCGEECGACEH